VTKAVQSFTQALAGVHGQDWRIHQTFYTTHLIPCQWS